MTADSQLPDCDYAGGNEDASKCNSSKCARHASSSKPEPEHLPMEIAFRDVTVSLGALQRLSRERDNAIAALVYLGHGDTASKVIAGTFVPPQAAKPPATVSCTCVCSDCLAKTAVHPFCRYSCKLTERFTCNHEPQCTTGSSHQARLHTDKEAARPSEFSSFAGSKFEDVLAATDGKSLVDALSDIATWENERAVAQALRGNRDPHTGALWDTCFRYAFSRLFERRSQSAKPPLQPGDRVVLLKAQMWPGLNDKGTGATVERLSEGLVQLTVDGLGDGFVTSSENVRPMDALDKWIQRRIKPHLENKCDGLTVGDCLETIRIDMESNPPPVLGMMREESAK